MLMSTESLKRTSSRTETPSQMSTTTNVADMGVLKQTVSSKKFNKRVNIDTLKQRLLEEKKKEKVKRTIILSSVIFSLGALTMLTY